MKHTENHCVKMDRLSSEIMMKIYKHDKSGRLLYLFCKQLCAISKLRGFGIDDKYKFVVITEDEYKKLKDNGEKYGL